MHRLWWGANQGQVTRMHAGSSASSPLPCIQRDHTPSSKRHGENTTPPPTTLTQSTSGCSCSAARVAGQHPCYDTLRRTRGHLCLWQNNGEPLTDTSGPSPAKTTHIQSTQHPFSTTQAHCCVLQTGDLLPTCYWGCDGNKQPLSNSKGRPACFAATC